MSIHNCGYCIFAEETEEKSSDEVFCWIKEELRKINDYPCSRFAGAFGQGGTIED